MAFVTFYLSVGPHALDKAGAPARQPLSIGRQPGRCPIASGRPPAAHKEETGLSSYEPDILARDLDVIFCGVNPATTAAVVGHNFLQLQQSLLDGAASHRLHRCPPSAARGAALARVPMRPDRRRRPADKTGHRCAAGRIPESAAGLRSQDTSLCPSFGRVSRQAHLLGDDGPAGRGMGPVSRRVCGHHDLDPAQPQRPQQSLLPRGAGKDYSELRAALRAGPSA